MLIWGLLSWKQKCPSSEIWSKTPGPKRSLLLVINLLSTVYDRGRGNELQRAVTRGAFPARGKAETVTPEMLSSVVAGHVRPTNWLGNCQGVPPLSYPRRGRVTDENLCVFEKVFGGETAYLWVRKSHVYGCDTPLRRPGSWRNNFLRRRTWRLRHDTLVRRRVSQRLVFATSRLRQAEMCHYTSLRQALVRQGPGSWSLYNLGLCPANERRRYFVTTSLIGWVQPWQW